MLQVYRSQTNDPYFNIATEEYFLKNFDDDFFYLYVNEPCLVVGKHQNTMAEINVPFVFENNLKVVRRLSGGGTVFHDAGNLNYCFIKKGVEGSLVDFKKYTQPIIDTLQSLGVNAVLRGKSDLVINDLKFSGNAEHVFRNKVLHHGTLLFNSTLDRLNEAIKADWSKFNDKAVRSNRSKVTNISEHLSKSISLDEFISAINKTILNRIINTSNYTLTLTDITAINALVAEKYATRKWNYGYSPAYVFNQQINIPEGILNVDLQVQKGIIDRVVFKFGDSPEPRFLDIAQALAGTEHHYLQIKTVLSPFFENAGRYPFSQQQLLQLLF